MSTSVCDTSLPDDVTMRKALNHVADLGLHGVVILGKPCPRCGGVHEFAVGTDLSHEGDVPRLLRRYAWLTSQCGPSAVYVEKLQ